MGDIGVKVERLRAALEREGFGVIQSGARLTVQCPSFEGTVFDNGEFRIMPCQDSIRVGSRAGLIRLYREVGALLRALEGVS